MTRSPSPTPSNRQERRRCRRQARKNDGGLGTSSDITVVNLGEKRPDLRVGDSIYFRPGYSAFVRLMNDPYIRKEVTPSLPDFQRQFTTLSWQVDVAKSLEPEREGTV